MKDKIIDVVWKAASIGLGLAIQAPTEVAMYKTRVVKINGKERPDAEWSLSTGVMESIMTNKPVSAESSEPITRRMIVFK